MTATVGRVVHFYNEMLKFEREYRGIALNGQGVGPYPAVVLQTFQDTNVVNLLVHAWGGDWREGSVEQQTGDKTSVRRWTWPPCG